MTTHLKEGINVVFFKAAFDEKIQKLAADQMDKILEGLDKLNDTAIKDSSEMTAAHKDQLKTSQEAVESLTSNSVIEELKANHKRELNQFKLDLKNELQSFIANLSWRLDESKKGEGRAPTQAEYDWMIGHHNELWMEINEEVEDKYNIQGPDFMHWSPPLNEDISIDWEHIDRLAVTLADEANLSSDEDRAALKNSSAEDEDQSCWDPELSTQDGPSKLPALARHDKVVRILMDGQDSDAIVRPGIQTQWVLL
ncbi:hypothetical protein ACS0TY_026662 [Phlomoides rotata]